MKYAMVIVLEAENDDEAWEDLAGVGQQLDFIGHPWRVPEREEYDTISLIIDRPHLELTPHD